MTCLSSLWQWHCLFMQFDLFWRIFDRDQPHKDIFIERLIILPTLWFSQMIHLNFQEYRVAQRVRDELATPLEWTSLLSCSAFNIYSILTETWELSCLFTTGFIASLLVWLSNSIQRGLFGNSCVELFPTKVKIVKHLSGMYLCLLFYPTYGWLGYFIQLLSLPNILPALEFIYYGERKVNVLKKPHKSGAWLYKIIVIFPVDEPVEHIYLIEFQIFIYTHTYIYCISLTYSMLLCASFLFVHKENTQSWG